jgi:hypothetical protein
MRLALLSLLAACAGKGPADPAYTPAGRAPCASMADHVVKLMGGDASRTAADDLRRALATHCTDDKWTLEAERCFAQLATFEESDRCVPLLTVEQREAFAAAIDAVFPKPAR